MYSFIHLFHLSPITSAPNLNGDEPQEKATVYRHIETQPSPTKSCDKATSTGSTKYEIAETQTLTSEHRDIEIQTESVKKFFGEIYKPLKGRISVTPVSTTANSILNERYNCSAKRRFYVTRSNYSGSDRWVVKGVRVLKRNLKGCVSRYSKKKQFEYFQRAYRAYISKQKLNEIRKFYKEPVLAVAPMLKHLH
ncbi:uncharacterized protein LOC129921833 [Biomphalaria glabrata]|uniref:Uncharacterized protein LOC129921833 n=1 Tax=Biomphalaria glabrata TaxID=6526 RepID=A0A9W2YDY8_BIOGL|nr:uncharacterized protein LOC129921833 [Biomphalaria glabrata]